MTRTCKFLRSNPHHPIHKVRYCSFHRRTNHPPNIRGNRHYNREVNSESLLDPNTQSHYNRMGTVETSHPLHRFDCNNHQNPIDKEEYCNPLHHNFHHLILMHRPYSHWEWPEVGGPTGPNIQSHSYRKYLLGTNPHFHKSVDNNPQNPRNNLQCCNRLHHIFHHPTSLDY